MGWLSDKILDTIFDMVKVNTDANNTKNEIENGIDNILHYYENEVFYNDFKNFLDSSEKIKQLIDVYFEIDINTVKTKEETAEIICDKFLEFANDISVSYRSQIRGLIIKIIECIDTALNEPKTDGDRRVINEFRKMYKNMYVSIEGLKKEDKTYNEVPKYDYTLLSNKSKENALRHVEQKSRAISRSKELPRIIERKVATHNKEEKVAVSENKEVLLNAKNNIVSFAEVVSVERPTFLFGELGSGKSTIVGVYVYELSKRIDGLISILIPAGFFRNKDIKTVAKLSDYISQYVDEQICPVQKGFNLIAALVDKYEITLVIDGFDELDRSEARNLLIKVEELVSNWSTIRVISTGRPIELQGLNYGKWQCVEMIPLTKDEQKEILLNEGISNGLSQEQVIEDTNLRLKNLYEMNELLSIATTPLTARLLWSHLKSITDKKTLGDLLYEITQERLGNWNDKQGKDDDYEEFNRLFPDSIFREKILGVIAAQIFKSPEKAITKESIYAIIEAQISNVDNKNLIVSQACEFYVKNILQENNNIITFPSQPLLQCAIGLYIYYNLKSQETSDLAEVNSSLWREYSFAAAITRRKNNISESIAYFHNYMNELLYQYKEEILPAIALIISELNDTNTALEFIHKLHKLSFRPLKYYMDVRSLSAASYARWFFLAGDEGFNWFFERYINPKYPTTGTWERVEEDLILKYWMIYSNFNISSKHYSKLSSVIEPYLKGQRSYSINLLSSISLIVYNFPKYEEYIKFVSKNLTSNIVRERAITILKQEAQRGNLDIILDCLANSCKGNESGDTSAARLWLELCTDKPKLSIVNNILSASIYEGTQDIFTEIEKRLGHKCLKSYLNWCTLKENKLATMSALILYKQGVRNLYKLGKGLILGLHDGGKISGAEDALRELIFQNIETGLEWIVNEFKSSDFGGAHSAYWRILLEGLSLIKHIRNDLFSICIKHLGEYILPRYPEIRRAFVNLLVLKNEYIDKLRKNLNSLNNELRYNSACILLTCFPEDEIQAAEIVIKSTTKAFNHGEWNSFCMRIVLGRQVLDYIYDRIDYYITVPKTFALALLYHNNYTISSNCFNDLVLGLLGQASYIDAYYSNNSDTSLKEILSQDSVFTILIDKLEDNQLSKEAAKALILNHYEKLDKGIIARCLCIIVDSIDTLRFYKIDTKIINLFSDNDFLDAIEKNCKRIQESTSKEPFISIYIRTLKDETAWKDLLWDAMFHGRTTRGISEIEWAMMWIFDKAWNDKKIANYIGIYASEFLQHPSITADRMYNYLVPWLTFIAHEFSNTITEEQLKHSILNFNYFEGMNVVLLSRLGYIPVEYIKRNKVDIPEIQTVKQMDNEENTVLEQLIDIVRDADEIHKDFCVWIDKIIIHGILANDELTKIAIKSKNGAMFAGIVLYCREDLTDYSLIIRVIGTKLTRLNNNQVAKTVVRANCIIMECISNSTTDKIKYFSTIETIIREHNHDNVIYLYKELLGYQEDLTDDLLPKLLSELAEHSYNLDGELANLLAKYFSNIVNEDRRKYVVYELKKAIVFIASEIDEHHSRSDGLRQWLFSLAYFYLNDDKDAESERVFLYGIQAAFIQTYSSNRNDKEFFAKNILNIVYPLIKKVPKKVIRQCVINGTSSDVPEINSCCRVLLAIMGEESEYQ